MASARRGRRTGGRGSAGGFTVTAPMGTEPGKCTLLHRRLASAALQECAAPAETSDRPACRRMCGLVRTGDAPGLVLRDLAERPEAEPAIQPDCCRVGLSDSEITACRRGIVKRLPRQH